MNLTPDESILWEYGFIKINATLVFTWGIMLLLTIVSMIITGRMSRTKVRSRWQNSLEIVVLTIKNQISEIGLRDPERFIPFLGTLFIFIAVSSLLTLFPGYMPPTGSLSTTAALAICVFLSVPFYGISIQGFKNYLRAYIQPTAIMLPFNIIGEISRTLALAVRLFGNMMSGVMIIGILLSIAPLLFPILMTVLGLITGMVQAYIFFILAAVYLAAATQIHAGPRKEKKKEIKDRET